MKVEILANEPFLEFASHRRGLVHGPAAVKISRDSASFELQIRNVHELEKSGMLRSLLAEEWRFGIRESTKTKVYNSVADHRFTNDKLAQARAIYRRRLGQALDIPQIDQERTRRDTLRELNDLWREIVKNHDAALCATIRVTG
jgi:hypothetical protein